MKRIQSDEPATKWPTKLLHFMSGKCYVFPTLKNHTFIFILLSMEIWLAGCQPVSKDSHNSVDDALASYHELFMAVKSKKAVGVEPTLTTGQGKPASRSSRAAVLAAAHSCTARAAMASVVDRS